MTDVGRSIQAEVDGPGRLMAVGRGPFLLRMGLRHETGPVRRFPSTFEALGRAGTALPPELFGGALLDVLGDRLREALAPPTAGRSPDERQPVAPWPDVPRAPAAPAAAALPDPTEPAIVPADAAAPLGVRSGPGGLDAAAVALVRSPAQRARALASHPTTARDGAAGRPALASRLAAYWRSLPADGSAARPARPPGLPPLTVPGGGFGAAMDGPARFSPAWAGLGDALIGERPGFAEGGAVVEGEGLSWPDLDRVDPARPRWPDRIAAGRSVTRWQRASEGPPNGRRMTGFRGTAAGGPRDADALQALSEEMAEILREQATRHGIDIS